MHSRLHYLYAGGGCTCARCTPVTQLAGKKKPPVPGGAGVEAAAQAAFDHLHSRKQYNPAELATEAPYKALVAATASVFNSTIEDGKVPTQMVTYLQKDGHIFSGLKANAQLQEATALLMLPDGQRRPYKDFEREVLKLNATYNTNYLEAEYLFAQQSAQSAARWVQFAEDGDRYNLQYRTASDDKVRASHAALQNTTLPADDPFWSSYFPPNGWRCRCVATQVRKSKFPSTDPATAMAAGELATTQLGKDGKNKLEIFRFNPGKDKALMPPAHPYGKVEGAKEAKKAVEKTAPAVAKPKFTPDKMADYESKTGVTVNPAIFELLTKETPLHFTNPDGETKGAFYSPGKNYVLIPIDARRKNSKWYAEAVVYHEYGHAVDNHHGLRKNEAVTKLMKKFRKEFKKDNDAKYIEIHNDLAKQHREAVADKDNDAKEKVGAALDTLMSLNPEYGSGHFKSYFERAGAKEAEFIAHCFENKFSGNEVFEAVMPELYKETISMLDGIDFKKQPGQP